MVAALQMPKPTDIQRIIGVRLYFIPVQTRVPLKFGTEALTSVTCARAAVTVLGYNGRTATGWGETPLSVQWVWPSVLPYAEREAALRELTVNLADSWLKFTVPGHAFEIGYEFENDILPGALDHINHARGVESKVPYLAGLVCLSVFDIATYDAFAKLHDVDVFQTLNADWLACDLSMYFGRLRPVSRDHDFAGQFPSDFLVTQSVPTTLPAWHLVGGLDALTRDDLTGSEPDDGYPVTLGEWIDRDGLRCLKIKLRGNDAAWDYDRIVRVGRIGVERGVDWLSTDFNCTVTDPRYVTEILDKLRRDEPRIYGMTLYVEQPFPYDLEAHPFDAHAVSAMKPLFLDESAHDWRHVRLGRRLGWTGVALKTCKTLTGALLSLCWARAHGMELMVQDLTNPMLAMIPHARLAAHAGTIMGVETNACQFYPAASAPEARVHPGLYQRRNGRIDLSTLRGPGFGYRLDEIDRQLPAPAIECGR